jgi:hypothetical protein
MSLRLSLIMRAERMVMSILGLNQQKGQTVYKVERGVINQRKAVNIKLYDVPEGSKLKLNITDGHRDWDDMCTFYHVDGRYSYIETSAGEALHLGATCEMRKVDDYYEIDTEADESK